MRIEAIDKNWLPQDNKANATHPWVAKVVQADVQVLGVFLKFWGMSTLM